MIKTHIDLLKECYDYIFERYIANKKLLSIEFYHSEYVKEYKIRVTDIDFARVYNALKNHIDCGLYKYLEDENK